MELETIIVEPNDVEMGLEEAQQAYNTYPETVQIFVTARDEWKVFTEQIMTKNHTAITQQEIEKSDTLYETAQRLKQECLDMKVILVRKLDDLIIENKELQSNLSYYAKNLNNDEDIECAYSLIRESLEQKDNNNLRDAIKNAYEALQCMKNLLGNAKYVWMQKHQEKIDSLSIDPKEAENG